jgi:hypothetical protein
MSDFAPSQTTSRQLPKARLPWFFSSSDYSLESAVATLSVVGATR